MFDNDWLEGLKVGDSVAVPTDFSGYLLTTITGETATRWKIDSSAYDKKTGKRIGSSGWHVVYLHKPTDDIRRQVLRGKVMYNIQHTSWKDLSLEALQEINSILKREAEKQK